MIRRTAPLLILMLIALMLIAGCSTIGGWFGGSENSTPPAELKPIAQPISIQQLWETRVGAGADEQFIRLIPALIDGRVYAASHDGTVVALDALSGQRRWEIATQLSISGGVGGAKGCYVGQEVTARTHYRGQVRKAPFILRAAAALPEARASISVS